MLKYTRWRYSFSGSLVQVLPLIHLDSSAVSVLSNMEIGTDVSSILGSHMGLI